MGKRDAKDTKTELPKAPTPKSGGGSGCCSIFFFALILGAACSYGFFHVLEELRISNEALLAQMDLLKNEVASVKESSAAIDFRNEIKSIGQLKEDLQQARLQINTGAEKLVQVNDAVLVVKKNVDSLNNGFQETLEATKSTESKMNTEAEKVNQVTDSLSTVKTNVETLSKDLSEIRETAKSSDSKVRETLEKFANVENSVESLKAESNAAKKSVAAQFKVTEEAIKAQQDFTQSQIQSVEKIFATEISKAVTESVQAKQLAEQSRKAAADISEEKTSALSDGLEIVKQNLAQVQASNNGLAAAQEKLAAQLGTALADAISQSHIDAVNGKISSLEKSLNSVLVAVDNQRKSSEDSIKSLEAKANNLNAHLKMGKNEVASLRELVTTIVASSEQATEAPPTQPEN